MGETSGSQTQSSRSSPGGNWNNRGGMQRPGEELDAHALADLLGLAGDGPLHSQLETGLRNVIRSGQLAPGTVLPGELDLAAELGVSRHTVRHALGVLSAEGLLLRERGRGTHVLGGSAALI